MMQRVQLSIADATYEAAVHEALSRSPHGMQWVASGPLAALVLVLDEFAFARLPFPLSNPERIVFICRPEPQLLAQAGRPASFPCFPGRSPQSTVLLAMAAALRLGKLHGNAGRSGISPTASPVPAPIAPENQSSRSKQYKTQ